MNEQVYDMIMRVILVGLVVGMLGMIQPFSLAIFEPAFLILFSCTIGYIVFLHLSPKRTRTFENESVISAKEEVLGQPGER